MRLMVLIGLLAVGALSAQCAMAEESFGFRGIGGSIAYVDPEGVDGTVGLGIFADLGRIGPRFGLEPHFEYWSHSEEAYGARASISDVAMGARGKYFFDIPNSKVSPFVGLGLGLHFLSAEASMEVPGYATMTVEGSDTKLGLDLGGGMDAELSPKVDLHAGLWYGIVSDFDQFAMRLGLTYRLGY